MSEKVVLERISTNGCWSSLCLMLQMDGGGLEIDNDSDRNEDEALSELLDDFETRFHFVNLRYKILQGFRQLRENDVSGSSRKKMEISVVTEDLVIKRSRSNGYYVSLKIKMSDEYGGLIGRMIDDTNINNEDEAIVELFDDFVELYLDYLTSHCVDELRLKVIEGLHEMQVNDMNGNSNDHIKIHVVKNAQIESHLSCTKNQNEEDTSKSSGESEISQFEVQQKLAIVDKTNKVLTFFEDNKCSVCLSSYKEILVENVHIVIPSCGHPLCCKCADNILNSEKKVCPRCRGNVTADSFNLMKFNDDLGIKTQDSKVFL